MNNEYDYKANFNCRMDLTVLAENKEEANRILKDTIESITDEKFKSLLSKCTQVEVKNANITKSFYSLDKNKEVER